MNLAILAEYILQSIMISALLLAGYCLLLRNGRFHQFNRFYLLLTVMISVSAPWIKTGWFSFSPAVHEVMDPVIYFASNGRDAGNTGPGISAVIGIGLLLTTSFIFLGILLLRLYSLYKWRNKYPKVQMQGFNLVQTDLEEAPFTFLNDLYWPLSIDMKTALGKKILAHECTHIRQLHSWDRLFMQIVTCLFWINPFYWMLKKELSTVHEFLADASSVEEGDGRALAEMLLLRQSSNSHFSLYHTFFQSPIKRRLAMITIAKKTSFSTGRKIFSLALVFVAFVFFSCADKNYESLPQQAVVEETRTIPDINFDEIQIDNSKPIAANGELYEIRLDKGEQEILQLKLQPDKGKVLKLMKYKIIDDAEKEKKK